MIGRFSPVRGSRRDPNAMSLGEHLEDLRLRVFLAVVGLVPIFALGLFLGKPLLELLIEPARVQLREAGLPATLQATAPLETFFAYVRIAVVVTLIVGSPWVLYQIWRFVSPGLYKYERRFVYLLLPMSGLLSAVGVVFLYLVIFPVILSFFIHFGSSIGVSQPGHATLPEGVTLGHIAVLNGDPPEPQIGDEWINKRIMQRRVCIGREGDKPVIVGSDLTRGSGIAQQYRISEYVKTFLSMAMAFAIGFQTPIVVLLLGWIGLIDRAWLSKYRRHSIMICAAAAAILTPADPLSMVLLAIPLYLLYELGSFLLWMLPASKMRGEGPDAEADEPTDESLS
ncbi:MAG: preprotein translocase subunit TatC [Phycisphaeraceae bacterium]|nr:preprotein translocase subunit TatC [Phycisphaeraceae bacterium]